MEGLVSDICVTYNTAGQLTPFRSSTRPCPALCVLFLLLIKARTAFSRRGLPRRWAQRLSWLLLLSQLWLQLKLLIMVNNLLNCAIEISDNCVSTVQNRAVAFTLCMNASELLNCQKVSISLVFDDVCTWNNVFRRVRKISKATIFVVMSVWPFTRMEQLRSYGTAFREIWYLNTFRKCVEKI